MHHNSLEHLIEVQEEVEVGLTPFLIKNAHF